MEGRFPVGIRTVLTNCRDASQDAAFNEWYDRTHLPDMVGAGLAVHALRYKNADPKPPAAWYLAIYETPRDDLERVGEEFASLAKHLDQQGRMFRDVEIVRRAMWRRIGPPFTTPRTSQARTDGLFIIESNCTDAGQEDAFNAWYDVTHIPDLLDTGLFQTAYRFAAVTPEPDRGRYLAIYETDRPPWEAVEEFSRVHRPRLKAAGRLIDGIEITWRGIYRHLISLTMDVRSRFT